MHPRALWKKYRDHLCVCESIGLRLDISRMRFPEGFFERTSSAMARAYAEMAKLEEGAIANPDEGRQVGHYWLRAPHLAPTPEQRQAVESALADLKELARRVHEGEIRAQNGARFSDFLVVGVGGSALGPQLVADALGDSRTDRLRPWFLDNTDPDGINRVLRNLGEGLARTLTLVISKSGGTPETRNGMHITRQAYAALGLDFPRHAVAITGADSKLDVEAREGGWLGRLPMWDWVGGRTSETSAVGLLPAALQGIDIEAFLAGARQADELTRLTDTAKNPAALLALMWLHATAGRGEKDMVLLPYRDRLLLLSRYLQQLVMESLGKGEDLDGHPVAQGIAVYGNKGSTDQHAYVQQLREGVDNFFVTFVEVLDEDFGDVGAGTAAVSLPDATQLEVEEGITAGDYLRGFRLGTREALWQARRESITVTLDRLDAHRLGAIIALYERAVGFYASLVNINAYHQPGVEAGKKAAGEVLALQQRLLGTLAKADEPLDVEALAARFDAEDRVETLFHLLEGLASNGRLIRHAHERLFDNRYSVS